jgi:RNA-directed DNA polymerase
LKFIQIVSDLLRTAGFHPNKRKSIIVPPRGRKVVLGLFVDGATPRLPRDFRDKLRQHMHYLEKFDPIEHMKRRAFETVLGMKRHIRGLIDFARMVDADYSDKMLNRFLSIRNSHPATMTR